MRRVPSPSEQVVPASAPSLTEPSDAAFAAGHWFADLHIHSKYSRACSRDLELDNLAWWAQRKGISVLGTGDITHPGWFDHVRERLVPAEPGLYRLAPQVEQAVARRLPTPLVAPVRFMLSVEISTIYKRDDRTRKVHHLVYLPDFEAVSRFSSRLGHGPGGLGGNLGSDGRPILGLDSRDLLEITLESSPDGYLVPAHIWTPWFSALGSKSGFDAIADCYADLAEHITAVETGLSSDPEMNWRVSSLDRYTLVSNSDAHSPQALAREATVFGCEMNYFSVRDALRTGTGLVSTVEFFPEEGKYHADGHRACGVCWEPAVTRAAGGRCPECGKPLTIGVLHRVEELADRPAGVRPPGRPGATHLIQLNEIVGEIQGVGAKSKGVAATVSTLVAALGSELSILTRAGVDDCARVGGDEFGEAIARLRRGQVRRNPGYDGEYGVLRLFEPGELARRRADAKSVSSAALFDIDDVVGSVPRRRPGTGEIREADSRIPAQGLATVAVGARIDGARTNTARTDGARGTASRAGRTATGTGRSARAAVVAQPAPPLAPAESPHRPWEPMLAGMEEVGTGLLDRLDALQRVAASAPGGPLLVVAGPGTGKTRTLTHRIAYLCAELKVAAHQCLAITFTRRAAEEMRGRLADLLGERASEITVTTFHALGLAIVRDNAQAAGLRDGLRVADDASRENAEAACGGDPDAYRQNLRAQNLIDLDELVTVPLALLRDDPGRRDSYRARWPWVFVDEYQDVDAAQYELLRQLVAPNGNICAIGDPDQAIYSFRGSDVGYFLRFSEDFVDARTVRLTRNYRSSAPIVAAALQAIAPSSLVRGRRLEPARVDPEAPLLGLHAAATVAAEADWVAKTIDGLVGGLSHRSFDLGSVDSRAVHSDGVSFADIAVLYRTDAQSRPVLEALTRAGIPIQKRSHDRLADRRAVTRIGRELRFAHASGLGLVERIRAIGARLAADAPSVDAGLAAESADGRLSQPDVFGAVELMIPLAERHQGDLEGFLQALAIGAEVDAVDPRAQAVALSTLHAAKGLEWPVVFIIGCDDGLMPLRIGGRALEPEVLAEERRLFFVGLTRAQRQLVLSYPMRRQRVGGDQPTTRTPFLDCVDAGLLERLGSASDEPARPRHRQLRLI